MNKQTAVEWLIAQLNRQGFAQVVTNEEIQQAKAMEKEQIEQAFIGGADFKEMAKNDNRRATAYANRYYKNNYRTILYKPEQNESI